MGSLKRVVKMYIKQFPVLTWVIVIFNIYNAVAAALPMVFLQKVTAVLEETLESGDWEYAKIKIVSYLIPLICIYAGAAVVSILNSQLMAYPWRKNGNAFQYSCLENIMDGEAWYATVHGVAKSQIGLSDFTFTFHAMFKVGITEFWVWLKHL